MIRKYVFFTLLCVLTLTGLATRFRACDGKPHQAAPQRALQATGPTIVENQPWVEDQPTPLRLGILQFHVQHNLETDACLTLPTPTGCPGTNCFLTAEDETNTTAWLAEIRQNSNMAVLHWDRSIPWLIFNQNPPAGTNRVSYYDGLLDTTLRNWLDAFVVQFSSMPKRYLAISPLNGSRSGLADFRYIPPTGCPENLPISSACIDLSTTTSVEIRKVIGNDTVILGTFDPKNAYKNFVLYLTEKLNPDYLALMVEASAFKPQCPSQWAGLVQFYHSLYSAVRSATGKGVPDLKLFATLRYQELLDQKLSTWESSNCYGGLNQWQACTSPLTPVSYPRPDPTACYPLDRSYLEDLNSDDQLDLLALSFYPDELNLSPPRSSDNAVRVYPGSWNETDPCWLQTPYPPFIDPMPRLDFLGWTKPVAIAEVQTRSCRTLFVRPYDQDPNGYLVLQPPGTPYSQAFWLNLILENARRRGFEFVTTSFLRDYPPLGLWVARRAVFSYDMYDAFNIFPCMGLYTYDGRPKSLVTDAWRKALGTQ